MVSFADFLPAVLFFFLFVPTTSATTWPSAPRISTHRTHFLGADKSLKLEAYHPISTYEKFGVEGVDPLPIYRQYDRRDTNSAAVSFVASKTGIPEEDIEVRSSALGQTGQVVFLVQKINGVPIANAVSSVAFNTNGKVSSFSTSFVKHSRSADIKTSISLSDAIATAEKDLDGTYNGHPTKLEFLLQTNGFADLTHVIQIQNDQEGKWYEAFVNAHNNTLVSVTDFVAKASYRALPLHEVDPTGPEGFKMITDPQNLTASPNGWHQEFTEATNLTAGNNAIAYKGSQLINVTVQSGPDLVFDYVADLTQDPTTPTNVEAATTNAFYVVNMFHDFMYLYGFTETAFNFQTNNFNKGGEGFDRILVSVQDSAGKDDALFATPPDGQSGKMQLFLYDTYTPNRDSALQNDVLIHECSHGASNRLTGGGTGRCFQTPEASAVAEGYADAMADWVSQQSNETTDFVFGQYGANKGSTTGFRTHAYSTSETINPLRYSNLKALTNVYDMGEVWANTLHNVYAELVTLYGWSPTALTDPNTNSGNAIWLHLFIEAHLLQPCNPTFIQARDAWIQADANRFAGANTCVLWLQFASRGFGIDAGTFIDDLNVPPECC